jgi:ribosomal protein L37AE/L43A
VASERFEHLQAVRQVAVDDWNDHRHVVQPRGGRPVTEIVEGGDRLLNELHIGPRRAVRVTASVGPRGTYELRDTVTHMDTVTRGLREDAIAKDTYGRLQCTACDARLERRSADGETVRRCPDCHRAWEEL